MNTELECVRMAAKQAIQLGWKVVPIKNGTKFPGHLKRWQNLDITIEQVDEYFYGDYTNIGVLTCSDRFVIDLDMNPWGNSEWRGKTKYPWGDMPWEEMDDKEKCKHKSYKLLYEYEQKYGDTNHYDNGEGSSLNTWQKWLDEYNDGKPLNTPTSRTGSGGMQIFVCLPQGVELTQGAKVIHPAIDTRSNGGQVVVSPSVHPNGKKYEWIITPETPIIECPGWLLKKLQGRNWKEEFSNTSDKSSDAQIDMLWKNREVGGHAKKLVESAYKIPSGQGRKQALCSIAGYWSMCGYRGEDLVGKVLPHLKRMEEDNSDPVDEARVRAICQWVDNKNKDKAGATRTQLTEILDNLLPRYSAFPVDALPKVVQSYVKSVSQQLGVPYDFLGGGILCVIAGAIGTSYGIRLNQGWTEPCILWHVILAETGSRKTSCFKAVWDIARDKERTVDESNRVLDALYQKQKMLYEKNLSQFKNTGEMPDPPEPPVKRILKISDATYESTAHIMAGKPCGTSIFRAEILGWVEGTSQYAKGKDGSRAFFLESYDGDSYTMTRVGSGHTFIQRNHLNIWGFSQPKCFNRILTNEKNTDDGFAPRFLISCPKPFLLSSRSVVVDVDSMERLKSIYSQLVDYEPEYKDPKKNDPITNYLPFDDKAQKVWDKWHKGYENLTNKHFIGKNHPFMPWWNKYPGQVARLILVTHIIRWKSGEVAAMEIDTTSIKQGMRLAQYFLSQAYETIIHGKGMVDSPTVIPHDRQYEKIAKWVSTHQIPMDIRTMLSNRCFANKPEADMIIKEWVESGFGIIVDDAKTLFVPIYHDL